MIDQLDTDTLRRLAHDVEHGWDTETGPSLHAAADEVDRLRAVIENAPHEPSCAFAQTGGLLKGDRYVCNCWKTDAL